MKNLTTLLIVVLSTQLSFSQTQYSRVKIYTSDVGLIQLSALGVAVDHGTHKKNTFFIGDLSSDEIAILDQNGFEYDIEIADVKAYYAERSQMPLEETKNATCANNTGGYNPPIPMNHFENNGYAGFYKYQDMLDALDSMVAMYPNLITARAPISTFQTHEGRDIFYVKISDNPSATDDAGEPNVLYTAIHHAREPLSLSQTIFYMWYLLENYATDPEVQFLVDNTEMYFVPCINPDGYIQNETNDPSGFGMHRKNKAPVGSSNPGVDLNRNYSYQWGTTGISWDPDSDVYPGVNAFSEPETQAIQWMVENYGFVLASNSHTYGDQILYPIGTTSQEFADHNDYFSDFSNHMAIHNGYQAIKSSGLYPASGDSDDYMYKVDVGVGMKDTIFAITPEVGDAFWPQQAGIVPTCIEMIHPNLTLSHLAHTYLVTTDTDGNSVSTMTGNFNHDVQRLGLQSGAVTVQIQPLLNILSVGAGVAYDLNLRETSNGTISYVLDPAIQFGDEIRYVLETDYGTWISRDTIVKTFGELSLQILEDASNTANWNGTWTVSSSEFVSPSTSFTDSQGNYQNNSSRTYEFDQIIDLTYATGAQASFYAMWEIEADYDYCQFQVSTDGGNSWIGQCGNYTVEGTDANGSVQPDGEPVFEGFQTDWVLEEISLSDYLGELIQVRFIIEADGGVREDGFYFDDFSISYDLDTSGASGLDELELQAKVVPNPANRLAYVSLPVVLSQGEMTIYDQAGHTVCERTISEQTNKIAIETGGLPQAVYFVHINDGDKVWKPIKLIVVH